MNPRKNFNRISTILNTRKRIIKKEYGKEIALIEKCIGQCYLTDEKIHEALEKKVKKSGRKLVGPKSIISMIIAKNNHFLRAAYETSIYGLRNPTRSLLRTVFEGIIRNYIYYLTKDPARVLYNRDIARVLYNRDINKLTKKQKKRFRSLLVSTQSECERILYNKKSREIMRKLYGILCDSTHPSIKGYIYDTKFLQDDAEDSLNTLLMLLVANLMQMTEVYLDDLPRNILRTNESLINKSARLMNAYPNFIPDNGRYKNKIRLHLTPR